MVNKVEVIVQNAFSRFEINSFYFPLTFFISAKTNNVDKINNVLTANY